MALQTESSTLSWNERNPIATEWLSLKAKRSEATARVYGHALKNIIGEECDAFLKLPKEAKADRI